ncbi:MAG: aldehyde ferredoxin oxidoreductase family protein [Proteobacteria bacterium]|nr:aldehyde ferredoxin oxidoreductase family protein [Pseudomonadota bacterium]MBU1450758.1 aldehyde ferredoxin oxidoreductase family protein [Pseudomonadota bacterium]MBU2468889.1 aldehyde ferredoxin oxidoreductase family protein [Pseudomonadota bacterium]MBU2517787.1 aldehyde ferredoxin oxidoreductase family protein [Pseudomonadota bacterium]
MYGYSGKALLVDLSSGSMDTLTIPADWYRDYIGGEGLAARYFWDQLDPELDPYDPQAPIIFATGPLNATKAPSGGRLVTMFRSPASNSIGISNVGGKFAPALKQAGWDLLVVKGKAGKPVFLSIADDRVSIEDAADIWGKEVSATEEAVKAKVGGKGVQVVSIGPAGENLVRFACIMTDKHRSAGRGGGGALMGSKNLKAIAVSGSAPTLVADQAALEKASDQAKAEIKNEPFTAGLLSPFGTPGFYNSISATGTLPTKNWQRTTYPESHEVLGHEAYHATMDVKPYACAQCPIACGRRSTIKEGPYAGESGGGPEYETLGAYGSKCLINDVAAVAHCGFVCNELGLDTISAGQIIATAMEWFERGILDLDKTGGIDLGWGNAEAAAEITRKMAYREGIGDLLADGSMRAAEKLGGDAMDYAFQVKGLEMASCGVRASKGEAVVHAVSPRGADHLRPYASVVDAFGYVEEELGIKDKQDPLADGGKAWVKPLQELSMATNLMGACLFASICLAVKPSTWAAMLTSVVGEDWSVERLLQAAERTINLERMINARYGFDRSDDKLPKRLLKEPAADGVGQGQVVDLEAALDSYYQAMGWDLASGKPTPAKLEQLGLGWTMT